MEEYYRILGIEPGASQAEVKRAYFQMVRKFSPEKDAEMFQKIRHAYEQLKKSQGKETGPVFLSPAEPFAKKMLEQINQYRESGNHVLFRDACEEAWKFFPDDIQFLYLLVIAQRQCGNTGKAVKNAELLVQKEPDNMWFQRELAVSYIERGFTKKAYPVCGRAYELGCRDNDFLLMYSLQCNEFHEYDRGTEVLWHIVNGDRRWTREDFPELAEAYIGFLVMDMKNKSGQLQGLLERFCRNMEQYRQYAGDYAVQFYTLLMAVKNQLCRKDVPGKEKLDEALSLMNDICTGEEELCEIATIQAEAEMLRIDSDERLSDTVRRGMEAFLYMDEDYEERLRKYARLDVKLCMIEERDGILAQKAVLEREYPEYYREIKDFIEKLTDSKKLPLLKDSLKKEYQRMSSDCAGGYYYELYPKERELAEGRMVYSGDEFEPYVRKEKKIGRNDPCPCGSGLKYKKCCGR